MRRGKVIRSTSHKGEWSSERNEWTHLYAQVKRRRHKHFP
ncbi:Protein of unknown function [Pyronema omphalodes CBS 100304]|uniref:Uncharacterized protein n=1 Tax=Pyronema omphalodes (strain CBS 100304) TaxID=1076935 RepID=U4L035_PYROM|nr:Protein of unknown function [Pyronema omphalodes CBS 100304]